MSIESEANQDLAMEPEQAEGVAGGRKAKKAAHAASPSARTLPLVVTVEAASPPVPGPADPGADNSGPEADDC